MDDAVPLRPEPQSAGRARAWVRERLTSMGHPELVDSATLATSELVTNAVLHARTGITVAVHAEGDEVRIEVADTSAGRLQLGLAAGTPEGTLTTVGNGLQIISALARRWGVRERGPGGAAGKTVWFVPATLEEQALARRRFPPDLVGPRDDEADPGVAVDIRDAPVQLLWQTRFRVRDVRREMLLLTLQGVEPDGVPHRLIEIAGAVDALNVAVLVEDETLEAALHREDELITLHYEVPRAAGPACKSLADLLDETDAYCRSAQLLTLAATPPERALRRWFLDEFDRQVRGEPPQPWPGTPDPARRTSSASDQA